MRSERVRGASGRREWAGEQLDFRGSKAHREPRRSSAVCGGLCETGAPPRAQEGGWRGPGHSPC